MNGQKKSILIIMGRYLPGYKDGGPVRSIKNLVDYLGEEYNFHILTCNRDHGDMEPYPNIKTNDWNQIGNAKVYYVPPKGFTLRTILKLSNQVDLIYLCGCFNDYAINTLFLKRINLIKRPVVVAAMGLFSPMEFRLKYKKKKLFISIFNVLGMFKDIYWSATSQMEVEEIKHQVWSKNSQFIAEDLPRIVDDTPIQKEKESGNISVVWISRITPKKNLLGAINILQHVNEQIHFTIYGPVHTAEYWEKCKRELEKLPANVKWEYRGNVGSEKVIETLKKHHIFLFPTLGENYGHVIQEALSAGCPCILSDKTPWSDLEEKSAGRVYSLSDIDKFASTVEMYTAMNRTEFQNCINDALFYAVKNSNEKVTNTGYRRIFDELIDLD